MGKNDFKKLENRELFFAYQKIEREIRETRDAIIDTLQNTRDIPQKLKTVDHETFNKIFLKDYISDLQDIIYDIFVEQRSSQEQIKQELYHRIELIKTDPKIKQIVHLCTKLVGTDIDIDNFLEFYLIIKYVEDIKKNAASHNLIDPLKEKITSQLN